MEGLRAIALSLRAGPICFAQIGLKMHESGLVSIHMLMLEAIPTPSSQ